MTLQWKLIARDGFTLIELLVVIAIVAILISLSSVTLFKALDASKGVQCASNLRQIATAMNLYLGDNRGYFPYQANASNELWSEELSRWMTGSKKSVERLFYCAQQSPQTRYGYNDLIGNTEQSEIANGNTPNPYRMLLNIDQPAQKVLAGCVEQGRSISCNVAAGGFNKMALVHSKKAMILFVDGHVASHRDSDLSFTANFKPQK